MSSFRYMLRFDRIPDTVALILAIIYIAYQILREIGVISSPDLVGLMVSFLVISFWLLRQQLEASLRPPVLATRIGNEKVHREATDMIRRAPRNDKLRAATSWFYGVTGPHAEWFDKRLKTLVDRVSNDNDDDKSFECRIAMSASSKEDWQVLRLDIEKLMHHTKEKQRFFYKNPLVLDCLITKNEALIAIPWSRVDPHLAAGILVRDPDMVEPIQRWYDDYVWDSLSGSMDVGGEPQLREIERRVKEEM